MLTAGVRPCGIKQFNVYLFVSAHLSDPLLCASQEGAEYLACPGKPVFLCLRDAGASLFYHTAGLVGPGQFPGRAGDTGI